MCCLGLCCLLGCFSVVDCYFGFSCAHLFGVACWLVCFVSDFGYVFVFYCCCLVFISLLVCLRLFGVSVTC